METYQHTVALFKEYKAENDKRKIVELLESFLRECPDADDMQICWAFWNLSDNYAMLRDASEEYRNHKLFEKKLMHMDEKYLHWIVSDGTQKLTLLTGGYEAYWNALYRYACEKAPKREDNAVIRFESHRATSPFRRSSIILSMQSTPVLRLKIWRIAARSFSIRRAPFIIS